ncbi:unnamed protein product [Adineta steineri]|uniref:Uncharacterized protein n=1 Tax=Adineta steineri TaxID=433720 RepID=A0A815L8A5_9BILA|nr:unnamed protein product [Adineta steineri]
MRATIITVRDGLSCRAAFHDCLTRKELYSNCEEVIRNEYVADDDATITKLKHQESSVESVPFVLNEQSLIVNEISNQPPQNQLTTNCNLGKNISINNNFYDSSRCIFKTNEYLSRSGLEKEIYNWNNVYARYFDHDVVYGTLGLSALYAHHFDYRIELSMRRALRHTHLVGVGEIGLDFEIENRPSDDIQIKTFSAQLRIAKEYKLPVVVTSRKSFIATLSCLTSELNNDHPVHWRNFVYGEEELYMLISKMNNVYFGCSLQIFSNKQMQLNIEQIPISRILPESVAPHISIKECPHVYATHPLFVIQVYKYIAHKFNLNIRQAAEQLVENRNDVYLTENNISQSCRATMIYRKNLSSSIKIDEILIKQKQNPDGQRNIVYKDDEQLYELANDIRIKSENPIIIIQFGKLLLLNNDYCHADYLARFLFKAKSLKDNPTLLASLTALHHSLCSMDNKNKNYGAARFQFEESLKIFLSFILHDNQILSATYNNIGSMYYQDDQHDQAIIYHKKALQCQLKSSSPDIEAIAIYSENIGAVYLDQGKHDQALINYKRSLPILQQSTNYQESLSIAMIYDRIASIY